MDGITQERPNECPILNFHKTHYRQSLNKTFGTHVEKSMFFKTLKKINSVSFLKIKLLAKNRLGGREKMKNLIHAKS